MLFLAILTACAPPATASPTDTFIPTSTTIPTQTVLPNCERQDDLIQQACISLATGLDYWAYVPSETSAPSATLPLLVYLHGSSRIGSNLKLLLGEGVPAEIEKGRTLAMVVASPQCPFGENWQSVEMVERLSQFVDEVVAAYHLDSARVSLTGFSMGGDGVWALGRAHSEQFAALAPVSSDWYSHDPANMCVLRDTPIWVFQSQVDEVVSPKYAQQNVAEIQGCGGSQIRLTIFPTGGHEATARQVYGMDELYQWFQKKMKGLFGQRLLDKGSFKEKGTISFSLLSSPCHFV